MTWINAHAAADAVFIVAAGPVTQQIIKVVNIITIDTIDIPNE